MDKAERVVGEYAVKWQKKKKQVSNICKNMIFNFQQNRIKIEGE